MEEATERAERAGYPPQGYRLMVREAGSHLDAAHRLLQTAPHAVHSGLWMLGWMKMIESSVEHHARLHEFQGLFTDQERRCAEERLKYVESELRAGRAPRPSDVPSRFSG